MPCSAPTARARAPSSRSSPARSTPMPAPSGCAAGSPRPLARRGASRGHRLRLPGAVAGPRPGGRGEPAPHRDPHPGVPATAGRPGHQRARPAGVRARSAAADPAGHRPCARPRREPDLLLLDEMTAALPADLTERVLDVVGNGANAGRSVIFISHRMLEIASLCDRATVLRDGETVGVLDVTKGAEERIVGLMLGPVAADAERRSRAPRGGPPRRPDPRAPGRAGCRPARSSTTSRSSSAPARSWASWRSRDRVRTSCSKCSPALARPAAGTLCRWHRREVQPSRRRHPGRPGLRAREPRRGAPAPALRAREHRPAIRCAREALGAHPMPAEERRSTPPSSGCRSTPVPQSEVRRLSGGNQQKVTIARWIAAGVKTLLCFDPTRGIDIRTKREIYALLRDLAAGGAAVLLYTSELEEIQLACDRRGHLRRRGRRRVARRRGR